MIQNYKELDVCRLAFEAAMQIFELSKAFPQKEKFAFIDQIRRSSSSVCANIAEAWCKRRYRTAFLSKLSDVETEATETQVWLRFAVACKYLPQEASDELRRTYDHIISKVVNMNINPDPWGLRRGEG